MAGMPAASQTGAADDDGDAAEEDAERENRDAHQDGLPHLSADDAADSAGPTREEAGADWLAEQGFDRKD